MDMSNYNNIQTEGHNTYFSAADLLESDRAEKRELEAKSKIWAEEARRDEAELIALIGADRAARAIKHFTFASLALSTAKAQIAAGKCKAA